MGEAGHMASFLDEWYCHLDVGGTDVVGWGVSGVGSPMVVDD